MIEDMDWSEELAWRCADCDCPLTLAPVTVSYMGSDFTTDMPHCPRCGQILVAESLALGKMAEVEKILEDK